MHEWEWHHGTHHQQGLTFILKKHPTDQKNLSGNSRPDFNTNRKVKKCLPEKKVESSVSHKNMLKRHGYYRVKYEVFAGPSIITLCTIHVTGSKDINRYKY